MIDISELLEMEEVEPSLWEEAKTELKKRIETAVKEFIDEYYEALIQAGYDLALIKHCSKVAFHLCEIYPIIEKIDEDYRGLYYEKNEDWDLDNYLSEVFWQYVDERYSKITPEDIHIEIKKEKTVPIDYKALRKVLKHQCEKTFDGNGYNPSPDCLSLVYDLDRRTLRIFKYIHDEICEDSEIKALIDKKEMDGIVERLIYFISKYDGTNIPVPYEDIDDWWGDYNHTINYIVNDYKDCEM